MQSSDLHAGYDQELLPGSKTHDVGLVKTHTTKSTRAEIKHSSMKEAPVNATNRGHCHVYVSEPGVDKRARRKLVLASILCLFFMIGEIVGGALAHSLAIMTDAAHLLTDFASFLISLLALFLAARPSTKKMSFGWYRAEVVGALASVLMIWLVTGILVYLAVMRIIHKDYEINGKIMLITSAIGVGVNIIMLMTLHDHGHSHGGHGHGGHGHAPEDKSATKQHNTHRSSTSAPLTHEKENGLEDGHSHSSSKNDHDVITISESASKMAKRDNITVRAAFIHVVGDLVQSVGVMVAAMIIFFKPELKVVDPICTFLFSVLVLITTINILRDTLNVLMEATPRSLDFNEVKSSLYDVPGVLEVHNLRLWSLTMNKTAVSVHLAIDSSANSQEVLKRARQVLHERYLIHDVTIQLEDYVAEMADCRKCQEPSV